ncbi:MAG: glucosaminidase domain-containing protein [Bacteroidetes bacterium]|nr:glucosaminidase domain-containing protein [Bacteroidota bacterium]
MSQIRSHLILLVISLSMDACSVKKPATSVKSSNGSVDNYINQYKDLAMSEMRRTGIPASITLAQGMIESDYGRSRLAVEANNHFGIKCHNTWKGPTITHHDDRRNECFRKYRKAEESYFDHSDFLTSTSRYGFLFELDEKDYKGWARGLKKAGYATNPDYANMLIRKIEEYELWRFDLGKSKVPNVANRTDTVKETPVSPSVAKDSTPRKADDNFVVPGRVSRIKENNRIQYIIVNETDTKEGIEKEYGLLKWELSKYNETDNDLKIVPGQILYLQPKRDKAEPGQEIHTVVKGETMYIISQRYGIKLRQLYEMNRMNQGEEPLEGGRIWLRSMKPVK